MTWLGPAITVEEFRERVVPLLGPGKGIRRFTCFDLSDTLELNDTVGPRVPQVGRVPRRQRVRGRSRWKRHRGAGRRPGEALGTSPGGSGGKTLREVVTAAAGN